MIDVLDYNAGNMLSLYRALENLNKPYKTIKSFDQISSKILIIPGVGNFANASKILKEKGFDQLHKLKPESRPFVMGICLGMQLLFSNGYEGGYSKGLNLLKGNIIKIPTEINKIKLPNTLIGWESIQLKKNNDFIFFDEFCFTSFYHVHSYMCSPEENQEIIATYPGQLKFIPSIVGSAEKKVLGFQFHPEKSSLMGLNFLNKAINYCNILS